MCLTSGFVIAVDDATVRGLSFDIGTSRTHLRLQYSHESWAWICYTVGIPVSRLRVTSSDTLSAIGLQNVAQIDATVMYTVFASQVQSNAVRSLNHVLVGQGFSQADYHGALEGGLEHDV